MPISSLCCCWSHGGAKVSSSGMSDEDQPLLRVATLNVHQWEDAAGRDNVPRVAGLASDRRPDVLCLQEASRVGQEEFQELVPELRHRVRFGGCAVLSRFALKEYHGDG